MSKDQEIIALNVSFERSLEQVSAFVKRLRLSFSPELFAVDVSDAKVVEDVADISVVGFVVLFHGMEDVAPAWQEMESCVLQLWDMLSAESDDTLVVEVNPVFATEKCTLVYERTIKVLLGDVRKALVVSAASGYITHAVADMVLCLDVHAESFLYSHGVSFAESLQKSMELACADFLTYVTEYCGLLLYAFIMRVDDQGVVCSDLPEWYPDDGVAAFANGLGEGDHRLVLCLRSLSGDLSEDLSLLDKAYKTFVAVLVDGTGNSEVEKYVMYTPYFSGEVPSESGYVAPPQLNG